MYKSLIIRFLASGLYLLRSRAIREAEVKIIVCTGSSGKTLTRHALTHALHKAGVAVTSPQSGYTNELGVVLATLGIADVSLFTRATIKKIFAKIPKNNIICVEIGSDIYKDIPWFIRRFSPWIVILGAIDGQTWARDAKKIAGERRSLLRNLRGDGFAICMEGNEQGVELLHDVKERQKIIVQTPTAILEAGRTDMTVCGEKSIYTFVFSERYFLPHIEACAMATLVMERLGFEAHITPELFEDYVVPKERLRYEVFSSGVTLLSDTYKAIPLCTKRILEQGLILPAKKRILILSGIRPSKKENAFPKEIMGLAKRYDKVYLVKKEGFAIEWRKEKRITMPLEKIYTYSELANRVLSDVYPNDLIVLKGAQRYRIESIRRDLLQDRRFS